ncbi:MAG: YbaB/EbfC family nucleoid-associated protein [Chloroflexi bacterium]|nr:YbaB/EbfC family nucleoid-associated protein [Chloroflexota bacterium]MCI0577162.1 YbaB/EbfC family nucleoid-associated protein [Chloroflexota bacterium]MCI0649901.1 YbaB/EbfC family nucleoid-associated protein [Chloroflexota bacterium]MCI0725671.1 YbaB/EbfC family nucleoid-associated protein [Chloroflexota bacterium]
MSKRPFRGGKPKKARTPSPGNLMAQFQEMQQKMAQEQEALANETVTVTSGGGAVTVVISGQQRVESIQIQPELLDPEDVEMLQDMLVAAVNSAIEQSQALAAQRMEGLTGGMGLNDLLGGLGGM